MLLFKNVFALISSLALYLVNVSNLATPPPPPQKKRRGGGQTSRLLRPCMWHVTIKAICRMSNLRNAHFALSILGVEGRVFASGA